MIPNRPSVACPGSRSPIRPIFNKVNALRLDWNELLPGDHCDYVMGNPPFIGHVTKTAGQTDDLKTVWGRQV